MLKEEEEDTVALLGKMKAKGIKITANCLVEKILLTRGVKLEGLRYAMRQVWRSIKEVKVESMGSNVFLFKFNTEEDKKRVLTGGPWHFDRALIILSEPMGWGMSKNSPSLMLLFGCNFIMCPSCVCTRKPFKSWRKKLEQWKRWIQMKMKSVLEHLLELGSL